MAEKSYIVNTNKKINGLNEKANISYDYEKSIKEIDLLFGLATNAKEVILKNMSKVGTKKKALEVLKCFSNNIRQLTEIRDGLMHFRSAKRVTNTHNTAFTNIYSNAEMVKMSVVRNLKNLEKQTGIGMFLKPFVYIDEEEEEEEEEEDSDEEFERVMTEIKDILTQV